MLNKLSMKWKVSLIAVVIFFPVMSIGTFFVFYQTYWMGVRTSLNGLMNFVDAKQQGVIRFLGQNEKLAKQLASLAKDAPPDVVRNYFHAVVATDVFDPKKHPFRAEIEAGKREIATWRVYHAIDLVRNEVIVVSSDPAREGRAWLANVDTSVGYSDVHLDDGMPVVTFSAPSENAMIYVNADARMLTLITNGEIGNLEGDMGTYYLAGVGKTFDYYIVNKDNKLITQPRSLTNSLLSTSGSVHPWQVTQKDPNLGIKCAADGTYKTNAGLVTGCRETMGFYDNRAGAPMLGTSMPFYDSGWTIVVEQEANELLSPLYRQLIILGLLGLVLAFGAVIIFVISIERLVFRPLKGLAAKPH